MPAWILTLKTSNDAVLRKEVPFEGYKSEISYLTEFYGIFGKITIVSMGKSIQYKYYARYARDLTMGSARRPAAYRAAPGIIR